MKAQSLFLLFIILQHSLLTACSEESSNSETDTTVDNSILTGRFLDSAVEGLEYESGTMSGNTTTTRFSTSGVTDSSGNFTYKKNDVVRFSIGPISINDFVAAKNIMTPLDVVEGASDVSNDRVINIARFLQTLDDDADPENGITITELVRNRAESLSIFPSFNGSPAFFENLTSTQTAIFELTSVTTAGTRNLVSIQSAQDHLTNTLLTLKQ